MDYQSLIQYEGVSVKITLINSFWYRAKILKVSKEAVEFIEEKGKRLTVEPKAVMMIEELSNGR